MPTRPPIPIPPVPGIVWREARREDVTELQRLQQVSHGPLDVHGQHNYDDLFAGASGTTVTICGIDPAGAILAFGSVTVHTLAHEHRAYLDGLVHPEVRQRGLGTSLLTWAEAHACELLGALSPDRPSVLTIDFTDNRDAALPLYERHGFQFRLAEDTMERALHPPLPSPPRPEAIELVTWEHTNPALFYAVYSDAFRDRPGFPGWSEAVWREAFTGSDSFRPDLSFLAMAGEMPVAYALSEVQEEGDGVEGASTGWISQMGVRPAWRGKGLGAALLAAVLEAFQAAGLDHAMLDVNVNNPQARRLYGRLGFGAAARRTVYSKVIR